MKWLLAASIVLVGCGNHAPKDPNALVQVNQVVPMSDGNAYIITQDDNKKELMYINGRHLEQVPVSIKWPEITPMADGTALLWDNDKLFRLEKSEAREITKDGEERASIPSKAGFFFAMKQISDKALRDKIDAENDQYDGDDDRF